MLAATLEYSTPPAGSWSVSPARPGDRDLVPLAAVGPHAVALGLAGRGVRGRGVERVPVVRGLQRAVGPRDRADGAGYSGLPGRGSGHRRPVPGAGPLAGGPPGGVGAEPVQGVTLGVGQHGDAV